MLTDDRSRFIAALHPGDLLLFDKLQHAGALIQFADNAPCSHCAIVVSATEAADATLPDATRDAVAVTPIEELLSHDYLHGVLALRLPGAAERIKEIRAAIDGYVDRGAEFEMLDLLALAPSTLLRAYHDQKFLLGPRAWRMLCGALSTAAMGVDLVRRSDCAHKLTCSEFIYRVYSEAELDVEILEPLPWRTKHRVGRRSPEHTIRQAARVIEDRVSPDHPDSEEDVVDPNLVTPGDLYRSPSFEIAARYVSPTPYRGSLSLTLK